MKDIKDMKVIVTYFRTGHQERFDAKEVFCHWVDHCMILCDNEQGFSFTRIDYSDATISITSG